MLAVSTCWKSSKAETGDDIIAPIVNAGLHAIELEYRITERMFRDMLPALQRGEVSVTSVHNFFPLPSGLKRDQASGDAFLLSSPDKEERELAVKYTLRTLEHAHELGASAVVLHLGKTDMDDGFSRLKEDREKGLLASKPTRDYVRGLLDERARMSAKYLDGALFSLDKLWRPAERLSVKLGIENRYRMKEVPNSNELGAIFERFEGSNIGYWHDVGHAAVQEFFYGIGHERQLDHYHSRLVGIHLHDAEGSKDHQPPGKGKVDFKMVLKHVGANTIRVIEVGSDVSEQDLKAGIDFLCQLERAAV